MGLTASAGQRGRVCLQVVDGIATAAQRYRSQMQSSNDALTMLAWCYTAALPGKRYLAGGQGMQMEVREEVRSSVRIDGR